MWNIKSEQKPTEALVQITDNHGIEPGDQWI